MDTTMDISQPIATLLRSGTAKAHEKAEHSEGAGWLTRGELDREEYIRFLIMLYYVYEEFEHALDQHATNPVLSPTYNPTLLARTQSLETDIAYLLQTQVSSWKAHPVHTKFIAAPPKPSSDYISRIQYLASSDPALLLAHAYVRYLGDLSGGQFIKRRLVKAYNLEDGAGVSFYEFKQLVGNAPSTIGDMKKIKEWYREGMNTGVGDDADLKGKMLEEANIAFELNNGLFSVLQPPSKPHSDFPAPPALGDPSTPEGTITPSEDDASTSKVVYEEPSSGHTIAISSLATFILAICLAQVFLVVGGFSGSQGSAKLDSLFGWISDLLPVSH